MDKDKMVELTSERGALDLKSFGGFYGGAKFATI